MREDNELLRQYLLGELPEEDQTLLEARLLEEGDLFERTEAVESDLLEEYAHGGLSAAQRARIGRHLALSPAARSRLAVIRGLATVAQEERQKLDRGVLIIGPWGRTELSGPWIRTLAAAAMLAIAVSSVWLASQTTRLPEEREQVIAATPAPPAPLARPAPPPVEAPSVPDRIARTEPAPEPAPPAPPAPPAAVISQLFELALTAVRGPEDAKELIIQPGTARVDIRLPLTREDEGFSSFQVVLRDADGAELIRRVDLQPVRAGEDAALVLPVEAELLRTGWYEMDVKGLTAEGDLEDLGYPQFKVAEPGLK